MRLTLISLLVCVFFFSQLSQSKVQKGEAKGHDFLPVARFWYGALTKSQFGNPPTTFTWYTSLSNSNDTTAELLVYDDQSNSWPAVVSNWNSWTCQQKVNAAANKVLNIKHEELLLNETYPRHWYVVFADCTGKPIDITYDFTFINIGGTYYKQFSMDEQGFWGIFVSFFIFYMILAVFQLIVSFMLHRASSFHLAIKIFTIVVILSFFAMMFNLIHYDIYAKNGVGAPGSRFFGQILLFSSHWLFIAMLFVVVRGTNDSSQLFQRRTILIALGVLFVLDVAMFIWRAVQQHSIMSPAFIYGSAPSIIMMIVRFLIGIYFVVLARFAFRDEVSTERRAFLFQLTIVGGIWLFFEPFIVAFVAMCASHSIYAYAMDRAVVGCWYTVCYLIFFLFSAYYFWPSRVGSKFDFSRTDILIGARSTSPYETL